MPIAPGVTLLKFIGGHMARLEDDMGGVVQRPVFMQESALLFHLAEKWSSRVGSEYVEGSAFEPIGFDPLDGGLENILAVVIEAEDEAAVYLNAVIVKDADAAGIILGARSALMRIGEILVLQRFKA